MARNGSRIDVFRMRSPLRNVRLLYAMLLLPPAPFGQGTRAKADARERNGRGFGDIRNWQDKAVVQFLAARLLPAFKEIEGPHAIRFRRGIQNISTSPMASVLQVCKRSYVRQRSAYTKCLDSWECNWGKGRYLDPAPTPTHSAAPATGTRARQSAPFGNNANLGFIAPPL